MKISKSSTAAAIISFTLVGATSAFALSTGAITGNSTPDPTPAAFEVVDAPVVAAPAAATPVVATAVVATPAPSVVDQVDVVAAATVPASSTDSVMSSTPDKSADMGTEAVEPSNERADKAEKADISSDRDSRDIERADKAEKADSSSDRDSRDIERADKTDTVGQVETADIAPVTSTID